MAVAVVVVLVVGVWTMKSFTPLWELLWEEGGGSMR